MTDHRAAAHRLLAANRRDGYTVPSPALYPFQWNWDSAFVACGLATVDPTAAKRELETLLSARWDSGLLPQIVFWERASGYFPGPEEWAVGRDGVETSGITQPPVVALAAELVHDATGDDAFARRVLPALRDHLAWWVRERTGTGPAADVVAVRHPWETGTDDSPAWVPVLDAFAPRELDGVDDLTYRRADDAVAGDQRPTDWDYDRYVALLRQARALDWAEDRAVVASPFVVEDVLTNATFVRACEAVARLAARVDTPVDPDRWRAQAAASRRACRRRLWDDRAGTFVAYDRVGDRRLPARTVSGLTAALAGLPSDEQFAAMPWDQFLDRPFALPSYLGPAYDPDRYWRGPVWANTNWLVARGLRRYGAADRAARVERDTRRLVERAGFREYFCPETGTGRGIDRFSWSAAVYLRLTS